MQLEGQPAGGLEPRRLLDQRHRDAGSGKRGHRGGVPVAPDIEAPDKAAILRRSRREWSTGRAPQAVRWCPRVEAEGDLRDPVARAVEMDLLPDDLRLRLEG